MTGPRIQRKPTFFWQGLLILLPVAVLAVIGLISLRQDKIIARHDAAERAQVIADGLVAKIWNELTANSPDPSRQRAFQVDEAGRLVFPPPYSSVPTPQPFNLAELNAEQARLWATLQAADPGTQKAELLDQAFKEFIDSNPPENFAGAAGYGQGLRLIQRGKIPEAAEALGLVMEKYPNATGESGLPLWPLAQFKLFEILPHPQGPGRYVFFSTHSRAQESDIEPALLSSSIKHFVSLDALCSNIVYHPTPLSPHLLACIQEDLSLPETFLPQTYHTEKLQEQRENERWARLRARPQGSESNAIQRPPVRFPRSDTQLIEEGEVGKWQLLWQNHAAARQLYAAARRHLFATARPAPSAFPLVSIGANNGNPAPANISFPGLFWFTTPNLLYVPNVPGSGKETAQNVYRSSVLVTHASGSIWNSNATTTLARSIAAGGTLDRNWLAVRFDDQETNHWFACRSESELGAQMAKLVEQAKQMPDYFGLGIVLAGRTPAIFTTDLRIWETTHHATKGGCTNSKDYTGEHATDILASAIKMEDGAETLKVMVYLTSPTTLYQRQGARAFWFGLLVAASTLAALAGLLTAWRAFRQQLQLNELKSNFVSSVSHELRAPIASVRLMAENLEGDKIPEPQKQKEYFGFIVQECRRLTSLIENVLDFSRIEQGRKQYEFEPTDVLALVQTTVKLMEPNAAEKGVALKLETLSAASKRSEDGNIEHRTPNIELEIDGRAIQQALVNLIDNAIKHSPKDETVTVDLEVRNVEPGNQPTLDPQSSTINLSVTDHGPGIPPAEHEKIFERFYRRGSELRRETQGVGIGLSIVKHIVAAHGGQVLVESEPGQGSRFTIELPIKK